MWEILSDCLSLLEGALVLIVERDVVDRDDIRDCPVGSVLGEHAGDCVVGKTWEY